MSDELDRLDYYTLLGVPDEADEAAIRRAFRAFARRYHPDRFVDAPEEKRERATRIYRRGSEAYQVLLDPPSRAAYDEVLERGITRFTVQVREQLAAEKPREPATPQPAIRSVEAQTYFRKAVELSKKEDWVGAWKMLRAALDAEPGNTYILDRLKLVDAKVRGRR